MGIKGFLTSKLLSGLTIRISDGRPFDPYEQKRTTWQDDLIKNKKEKNNELKK
jgi:hypothetical protein